MKKLHYKNLEEFENAIKPYKVEYCIEGTIYLTNSSAYKIIREERFRLVPKVMESIAKLDSTLLTVPTTLIYFDDEEYLYPENRIGFGMINGGHNLWKLLLKNRLDFEEKKKIAYQMKKYVLT